jgi:hypothetical protein
MLKRSALSLLLLSASALLPSPLSADGMYIPPETEASTSLSDITSPDQHVILVDRGDTQEMVVRVRVQGAPKDFAWILPLPSAPLETPEEFPKGDDLYFYLYEGSGPDYVEAQDAFSWGCGFGAAKSGGSDLGGEGPAVDLLGSAMVGSFQLDTLSAASAPDLSEWLTANGYQVPAEFAAMAKPYIDEKWVFLAMKLATDKKLDDQRLQVMHLKWKGDKPVFPMRLTAGNAAADGTVVNMMLFSKHRMDVPGMETRFAGIYPDEYSFSGWASEVIEPEADTPEGIFLASLDGMWWTRLDGTFSSSDMDEDLWPVAADDDESYRETKKYVALREHKEDSARPWLALFALAVAVAGVLVGLRVRGAAD